MDSPVMHHYLGSVRSRAGGIAPGPTDPDRLDQALGQARTDLESQARRIQDERTGLSWDDALVAAINARPRALDDAARAIVSVASAPVAEVAAEVAGVAEVAGAAGIDAAETTPAVLLARSAARWNVWAALGIAVVALVLAVVAVVLASGGSDSLAPEGTDSVPATGAGDGDLDAGVPEAPTYSVDESPTGRVGKDTHALDLAAPGTLSWDLAPTAGCANVSVLDADGVVAFERTNVCTAQGADWDLDAGAWRVVLDYTAFTGDVRAWLD